MNYGFQLIRLLRPQQWLKNGFVFLPMFFSGGLLYPLNWLYSLIGFAAFSMAASAVYCLNDIKDVEADRRHPKKSRRPIASGAVSVGAGVCVMLTAAALAVALCFLYAAPVSWRAAAIVVLYLLLNTLYCFRLKQIAIIDVMIVSVGFVLRLVLGGVVCEIWLSPWIVCLTFLLALFLAFAKRRDDVVLMEQKGIIVRKNIVGYNLDFLNQTLGILATVTIVCYLIYCLSPEVIARMGTEYLYISAVFVLGGILRYLQITIVKAGSGSPTKVLVRDRFVQTMIALWIITFVVIIYT